MGDVAFDYPPFRRAVPHGQAVRRDPNLDELVLTVVHDSIHVVSMNSAIGETIIALRLALLELEFRLWTYMGPADPEAFTGAGVAPLRDGDLAALAQAEAALEITRKLQILKDIWGPWLEGLAVFGELGADAPEDASDVVVSRVLANLLFDESAAELAEQSERPVVEVAVERVGEAAEDFSPWPGDGLRHHGCAQCSGGMRPSTLRATSPSGRSSRGGARHAAGQSARRWPSVCCCM